MGFRARAIWIVVAAALAGCGGGGGGSNGPFAVESVEASGVGTLPASGVFLDAPIVFHFSKDVDPASVGPQSIRIELDSGPGPDARGAFHVAGRDVVFAPALPVEADLSDVAYDLVRGGAYRAVVEAGPAGVRARDGSSLAASVRTTFAVRTQPPFWSDRHAGPPRVIGVLVDLDGDGVLDGDGACGADPEEFLAVLAPEFAACAASGVDFDAGPFLANVRPGTMPQPLAIGLLLSEPLLPASIGDETAPGFRLADTTHRVDSNGDGQPDVDRALPAHERLTQEIRVDLDGRTRDFVLVTLTLPFAAPLDAVLQAEPLGGVVELADPRLPLAPFAASLRTAATPTPGDAIVEEFSDRARADSASTAPWDTSAPGALESGTGLGGGGADGVFPPDPSVTTYVLDTSQNGGRFDFTSFSIPAGTTVFALGPNPLRVRSIGDVTIDGFLDAAGRPGDVGTSGNGQPTRGGRGGPGGGAGGGCEPPSNPDVCSAATPCFSANGAGPGGGRGGRRALDFGLGAGGGGGGSFGTDGADGSGGGVSGAAGDTYGNPEIEPFVGGSGGGAGGGRTGYGPNFPLESCGGGGGGGGGAVLFQSNGTITIRGGISIAGGDGGDGPFLDRAPSTGAGGGGSSGALKLQAHRIASSGYVIVVPGWRGQTFSFDGSGGNGGFGRLRFEDDFGAPGVQGGSRATLDPALRSTSFAQSLWIATNATDARYGFDGSDPATGRAILDDGGLAPSSVTDVAYSGPIDRRVTLRFAFAGADPLPTNPNVPDLGTDTGFVTDVAALAGRAFVRFRVEFVGDAPLADLPPAVIDRLRVRLLCP
jgi:hypothetical protein